MDKSEYINKLKTMISNKEISIHDAKLMFNDKFTMNKYDPESIMDNLISLHRLENSSIMEAEEDHQKHMSIKNNTAKLLNKNIDDLKNKKYSSPEKSKRADMTYKYKENIMNNKHTTVSFNDKSNTYSYISKNSPKQSDINLLNYMKKHSDLSDPKEAKKYRTAFNMFCNKYGIKPNSSLYIKYNPDDSNRIKMVEWQQSKKITRNKLDLSDDHEFILPPGYQLIHRTNIDGLTELKPHKTSNKYIQKGKAGINGQYHSTGRIYFILSKEGNTSTGGWGNNGSHVYKLISNISGFFIDYEGNNSRNLDRYADIKKLLGKPVYVKTDKPLKVKQLE